MSTTEINKHIAFRRSKADSFIKEPGLFKVCDQCQSIAVLAAKVCPLCKAYRWRLGAHEVKYVASIIGNTPFPTTAGTAPRL
jgi:hypothetical protein